MQTLIARLEEKTRHTTDTTIHFFPPPTVPGFGNASGFELRLLDRGKSDDLGKTATAAQNFIAAGSAETARNWQCVYQLRPQLSAISAARRSGESGPAGRGYRQRHEQPPDADGQLLRIELHPLRADVQGDGAGRPPLPHQTRRRTEHAGQKRAGRNGALRQLCAARMGLWTGTVDPLQLVHLGYD